MLRISRQPETPPARQAFSRRGGGALFGIPLTVLFALLLSSLGLLSGSMPSQAHHRHQYYFHWSGFPTQIPVYNCNADAARLQTAVNNWNANGGFGIVFTYGGTYCSAPAGIIAYIGSGWTGNIGAFSPGDAGGGTTRPEEVLKDPTQLGRQWYEGIPGQIKVTRAYLYVGSGASVNVYAHELGHAIGLNEHYNDAVPNGSDGCSAPPYFYPTPTIMDCPDGDTGPRPHDAADGQDRYKTAPWGPGAIWLEPVAPANCALSLCTSVRVRWAEINDNESGYRVMRTTAPGIAGEIQRNLNPGPSPDQNSFEDSGLTAGAQYCYHLRVMHFYHPDGYSSQVCRNSLPSAPLAPTGVSVASGGNNYTANLTWTQSDPAYTHQFITVTRAGSPGQIARYYLPYSGTGQKSMLVTLGIGDQLPGTYYFTVSTCNQTYNAFASSCAGAPAVTRFLSP
jgi:hypothetical protein